MAYYGFMTGKAICKNKTGKRGVHAVGPKGAGGFCGNCKHMLLGKPQSPVLFDNAAVVIPLSMTEVPLGESEVDGMPVYRASAETVREIADPTVEWPWEVSAPAPDYWVTRDMFYTMEPFPEGFGMLEGQNGRRDKDSNLFSIIRCFKSCSDGYFSFSKPNISAYQPVHGLVFFHIRFNVLR